MHAYIAHLTTHCRGLHAHTKHLHTAGKYRGAWVGERGSASGLLRQLHRVADGLSAPARRALQVRAVSPLRRVVFFTFCACMCVLLRHVNAYTYTKVAPENLIPNAPSEVFRLSHQFYIRSRSLTNQKALSYTVVTDLLMRYNLYHCNTGKMTARTSNLY